MDNEKKEDQIENQKEDKGIKEIKEIKEPCCCSERKTERGEAEKKSLQNRLSRIEGQIRGIKGMLEKDAYCPDILVQSAAVSAAMNAFNRELLASHIKTCVVRDIKNDDPQAIPGLLEILQKLMR